VRGLSAADVILFLGSYLPKNPDKRNSQETDILFEVLLFFENSGRKKKSEISIRLELKLK